MSGLRGLGLGSESVVVVHSSLRSFGRVEGGAAAVAKALVSVCGTVVAPSWTWDRTGIRAPPGSIRPDNAALAAATWEEFDAALDRAVPFSDDLPIDKELGAIPEALRLNFTHVRGRHPLLSFLAIGTHAKEVIHAERLDWPLGSLEAMAQVDGEVLLLGVGRQRFPAMPVRCYDDSDCRCGAARRQREAVLGRKSEYRR